MRPDTQRRVELAFHDYLAQQEVGSREPAATFLERRPRELHAPLESLLRDHAYVARAMRLLACRLAPGARLGDYLLVREVARGSLGPTWEAFESVAGRRVCLQVMRGLWEVGSPARHHLSRLLRFSAQRHHPGLIAFHDLFEHEEILVLVQEFVPGGDSLAQALERRRAHAPAAGWAQLCSLWIAQAADALAALHQAGILHGALRPSRVLLTPEGHAKVAGIGLGVLEGEPRLPGWRGEPRMPYYAAPEQVTEGGAEDDPRSDQFSLGAVLYALLAGQPPFGGASETELARNIVCAAPPAPHRLRHDVPERLSAICLRALAKAPEQRYPTMAEFAAALSGASPGST